MKPLGRKILVKDIIEDGVEKLNSLTVKTVASGIITAAHEHYRKVEIIDISPESQAKYLSDYKIEHPLKVGDVCLCNPGGVELETGLWLCDEGLLDCKL
jgi:hypothetical protein